MPPFEKRKIAFVELGSRIQSLLHDFDANKTIHEDFASVISQAKAENAWFTEENILFALRQWGKVLTKHQLDNWLNNYSLARPKDARTIGVIMAGNIPLVGFHDFLAILVSGHKARIKLSSNDKRLLPYLAKLLVEIEPAFKDHIHFEENTLKNYDAVIATGSNNTARYFEYYFRNKPHIIRKNRNAVALLTGNETAEELNRLGEDIFRYFGLGCRNVSKLMVPRNYDFKSFFEGISNYNDYINNHKYANNYDYNKAVFLMSDIKFQDNGFLIVKPDSAFSTPIGVLNYEEYTDEKVIDNSLKNNIENIQCVVGNHHLCGVNFGESQHPKLSDYADGVDTITFLSELDTTI